MADFLEERIHEPISYGSSYQDDYAVNVNVTSGGQEYRSLVHRFPVRRFDISYMLNRIDMWAQLVNLYQRAYGKYAGFRARCYDEYSSNGSVGTPTPLDQPTLVLTATTRQLVKQYGTDKTAGATGYPYRVIKKPVAGTVVAAKNGVTLTPTTQFTVDTTTGIVTVPTAIITDTITAGFQFDFPVRFDSAMPIGQDFPNERMIESVVLVELLNP